MQIHDSPQAVFQSTVLFLAAMLLIPCFGFCVFALSPAFAEKKSGLEEIFVTRGTAHFVAVNGNDNGPGTAERPWATINHAAQHVGAGDTVVVRGGRYVLPAQVRLRNSGRPDAWITFIGYPGEVPILDAHMVQRPSPAALNNGAFQIEGVSHLRVANLTVINSHDAGFTVRDSSNIDLINNSTKGTFSSGIAVWNTNHDRKGTEHIRIIGNTITQATIWDLAPPDELRRSEPPHEALSIGGAVNFEVAYNHVFDSGKEGIVVKQTSKRGKVHHNLVHNLDRQGIYIGSSFGELSDVEAFSNVIHDCRGAGLVLSVENGKSTKNISIHNNLIFNNDGSGLYFSRWGVDGARHDINIFNNIFYHNGYGPPKAGQTYYWHTGGLYLYSTNVYGVSIGNNVFSDNRGFQIGYSDLYLRNNRSWQSVAHEQKILITANLIDGGNRIDSPIKSGGDPRDQVNIYAVNGNRAIFGNPLFRNPTNQDFTLRRGSSAAMHRIAAGPYPPGSLSQLWWKQDFPPRLVRMRLDRPERGKAR